MALIGVLLAAASALFASGTDVLRKYNSKAFDPVTAAWGLNASTFLLAIPVTLLVNGIGLGAIASLQGFAHPFPASSVEFWFAFGMVLLVNIPATILWMRVLGRGDLSFAAPLITLTPVLILITAPFITGEVPSLVGLFGVLIITVGLFLLASPAKVGFRPWTVFSGLARHPVYRDALIVAVLFAVGAPWEKRVVLEAGSVWYTLLIYGGLSVVLIPFMLHKRRFQKLVQSRQWLTLLPFGVFNLLRAYAQFTALVFLPTFYVTSLKRSGILLNVVWGRLFFKEKETGRRLFAAAVMLVGAILILWASLTSFDVFGVGAYPVEDDA